MITYNEENRTFKLDTPNTTYMIGIVDEENFVGHIYYGRKLKDDDAQYLMRTQEAPFVPSKNNRERCSFYDCFPFEYPAGGTGDYREGCINIRTASGHAGCMLSYVSHEIMDGKPSLEGLPATFGTADECSTLKLVCEDKYVGMKVELLSGLGRTGSGELVEISEGGHRFRTRTKRCRPQGYQGYRNKLSDAWSRGYRPRP